MTVDDMIIHLTHLREHGLSGSALVKAYDGDTCSYQEVTGAVYDAKTVELQTDNID